MISTLEILRNLIAFDTVSRTPNRALIDYVCRLFAEHAIETTLVGGGNADNVNLYAQTGPSDQPAVMLSGHSDVVPVVGQSWSLDPFALTERDGRLYGRGTADMKGFVACAVRAMLQASTQRLKRPLALALSYDEEIGCVGVKHLLPALEAAPVAPAFCIVGEPTELTIATGHKGKTALRATCHGVEVHSALAPFGFNAIHLAGDFITAVRQIQRQLIEKGISDDDYDVPYSTIHIGLINGGIALNIVPNECVLDFEIRNVAGEDVEAIITKLEESLAPTIARARELFPKAGIDIEVVNAYPGLATDPNAEIVALVKSLTGANATRKVAFGTEGGLFSETLGIPTVVCGPGSMDQGHKPDEYVALEQLRKCENMLDALIDTLVD